MDMRFTSLGTVFALTLAAGTMAAGLALPLAWAVGDTLLAGKAPESEEQTDLGTALAGARVSLAQGFAAAKREGTPISGKYELDKGKLQLSVYTLKDGRFSEVIVDHVTGAVARVVPIEDGQDA